MYQTGLIIIDNFDIEVHFEHTKLQIVCLKRYILETGLPVYAIQDDEPVGFVTIFSIRNNLPVEAVGKNKPIYKLLTQNELSTTDTGVLYCHCFLLLSQYRGQGLIYKLYDGF